MRVTARMTSSEEYTVERQAGSTRDSVLCFPPNSRRLRVVARPRVNTMAPITALTFGHTLDAYVKAQDGPTLARSFDLLDFHAEALFQGLSPREKTLDVVS